LSLTTFPEGLGREFLLPWETNLRVTVRNLIFPFSLATFLSGLCFFSRFKSLSKLVVFSILFLTVFELFRFGWKFTPLTDPNLIYPSTPVLDYLKKVDKPTRINTGDTIPISMWIPYGLESSSGYDAVYPLRWAQFLSAVNGGEIIRPMGRYGPIHKYNSRLFDLSNNCYLMAVKREDKYISEESGEVDYKFQLEKLENVFEDKSVIILKNKECLPRAFVVNDYLFEKDPQKIIEILKDPEFPLNKKIILEKKLPFFNSGKGDNKEAFDFKLEWLSYESDRYKISTELEKPGLLFVSDQFYPGWKAYVDGEEAEIYRADFVFRAIYLPSGKHDVVFSYEPESFKIGIIITLSSFILLIILLVYGKHKKSN
ncbi:YfhO family protein, partial [Patescibacteria group bacterium]|nr:YfhO family protein [Patescibacteria group bacterium]